MAVIGDSELAVMEVLWRQSPLTAQEVAERAGEGRDWSVTTVKTMLGRLLAKGVLAHEEDGRRFLYRPAVSREDYTSRETRRFADRLFGGRAAPLVAHLAEGDGLTSEDIAELEALLKELRP
ncbi:putative transcriptional regulator [Sphingomonas vulcanisoli]|uniref:Transcriptional regulator n=1 Tax=Sphingomonas vulcanisoli TaxID=1658060 RepID=A0ABX0TQG8_9SPHN|nr:putative transcriptional regulator [Sphingomonas vulcanisoli]